MIIRFFTLIWLTKIAHGKAPKVDSIWMAKTVANDIVAQDKGKFMTQACNDEVGNKLEETLLNSHTSNRAVTQGKLMIPRMIG